MWGKCSGQDDLKNPVSEGENTITVAHVIVSQLGAKLMEELRLGWRTV